MGYRLRRPVTGVRQFCEISKDQFEQLRRIQKNLRHVLSIEETFDLLLENYAEFERDYLGLGLRLALFGEHGEPLGPRREVNRRIGNLLSSAYLYTQQAPKELEAMDDKGSGYVKSFEHHCNQQKTSLAYRAMEALRNHAQHFGFPVHEATHGLEWENASAEARLRARLDLFVNVRRLREDRYLNRDDRQVVNQLAARVDRYGNINLTPLVREYMERLCELHKFLRGLISVDVASWDQTITVVQDLAHATFGEDRYSIVITAEEEEGIWEDSENINVELIKWRKSLEAKNGDFGKLSALYVTGA